MDDSSSDDDNPFNPDLSASDSDGHNRQTRWSASDDRPPSFGSAPHPAPSPDGSSASSISPDRGMHSIGGTAPDTSPDSSHHAIQVRQTVPPGSRLEASASPPSRRDKKPPPPPKSHHGRRISSTAVEPETGRSRSTNRLSVHGSNSVMPGASPSTVSLPSTADYSGSVDNQRATEPSDSLSRSHSQNKRPPTPPLSRRHSQMRRSKSTQSKHNRLTMSSYEPDSGSNDGSRPPSPGPSTRSLARKRISMPPPSSDFHPITPLADVSSNLSPPTTSRPASLKAGRRASSYGTPGNAGSPGPPPPPPPRRTRDSMIRSSDSVPVPKVENQPPSNALDILADLTKLQKEVDDLRGHYENRK